MIYLLSIVSFAFFAATAPPPSTEVVNHEAPLQSANAGLQVVVDPISGQIVNNPTDGQLERVAEGIDIEARRSSWELREFRLSSGGRGVFLDGWADHSLRVEVAPDGQLRAVCSQGDAHGGAAGSSSDGEKETER